MCIREREHFLDLHARLRNLFILLSRAREHGYVRQRRLATCTCNIRGCVCSRDKNKLTDYFSDRVISSSEYGTRARAHTTTRVCLSRDWRRREKKKTKRKEGYRCATKRSIPPHTPSLETARTQRRNVDHNMAVSEVVPGQDGGWVKSSEKNHTAIDPPMSARARSLARPRLQGDSPRSCVVSGHK